METTFLAAQILAYMAAACSLVSSSMRRMIPLRTASICGNCFSIAYGMLGSFYPILILHLILLPLNVTRLYQMRRLVRNVRSAASGDLSMQWLERFMSTRRYKAGEVMFRKGDVATHMYYIVSGGFRVPDLDEDLAVGEIIGELGIASPDGCRTQTIACTADGQVLSISYDEVRQLYFENPQFGFYLLRLISGRLHQNLERAHRAGQVMPGRVIDAPDLVQS